MKHRLGNMYLHLSIQLLIMFIGFVPVCEALGDCYNLPLGTLIGMVAGSSIGAGIVMSIVVICCTRRSSVPASASPRGQSQRMDVEAYSIDELEANNRARATHDQMESTTNSLLTISKAFVNFKKVVTCADSPDEE